MPRITYLLSQYPTQNRTCLLRGVRGLRRLGWTVSVISLRRPDRAAAELSPVERDEAAATRYVLTGWSGVVVRAAAAALRRPVAAARVLVEAVRRAPSAGAIPAWIAYALEALVINTMVPRGEHVHLHFCMQVGVLLDGLRPGGWSLTVHGPAEFDGAQAHVLGPAVRRAALVRTISAFGRAMCLLRAPDVDPERVVVNRLGLFLDEVPPPPPRAPSEMPTFVTVGRLSVEKGQDLLLRAFAAACARGMAARLVIVGGGPIEGALRERARRLGLDDRVTFTGWIRPDQVPDHVARADAFVSASFAEGIPLVLMEAMSQGIPCIATAVGGVPELIRDGETGLLVAAGDEEGLTAAFERMAGDGALRTALAERGRRAVSADYNLARNIDGLGALLAPRCAEPVRPPGHRSTVSSSRSPRSA